MADTLTTPLAAGFLTSTALTLALALVGLAALARQRPRLRGTTLMAVWAWSLVSLASIAALEIMIAIAGARPAVDWVASVRLATATSTFCPLVARLGAKRPQDRAWQLVVAALWPILSLPSLDWWLFGGVQEIHPAQLAFYAILIGTGVINAIATRAWLASLLYAAGQLVLLSPYFPPTQGKLGETSAALAGLALIVAAQALTSVEFPAARANATRLDRVWLDFRDAFGAVWALRVMERMNAQAVMYGWPVSLSWSGFCDREKASPASDVPRPIEDSLRTLLRRFVSADWIDQRIDAGRPSDPTPIPAVKPPDAAATA